MKLCIYRVKFDITCHCPQIWRHVKKRASHHGTYTCMMPFFYVTPHHDNLDAGDRGLSIYKAYAKREADCKHTKQVLRTSSLEPFTEPISGDMHPHDDETHDAGCTRPTSSEANHEHRQERALFNENSTTMPFPHNNPDFKRYWLHFRSITANKPNCRKRHAQKLIYSSLGPTYHRYMYVEN